MARREQAISRKSRASDPGLSPEALQAGVRRLAPFHHDIELAPGIRTYVPELARREFEKTRLQSLLDHAWPTLLAATGGSLAGKRVLDVACNCGGFSVAAARAGASEVLGIDITPRYIQQANFVKKALSLENVRFEKRNLVTLDPAKDGTFDVVLCLGILYHLENPVAAMRKVAAVTDAIMLVDTDLIPNTRKNRPMWWMNFPSPSDVRSGSAAVSLWRKGRRMCQFSPNAKAVTELLKFLEFETVTQLPVESTTIERRYSEGRRGTFLAVR